MFLFPKPTKRPKRKPKPLKRSRIKPGKSKFKAHGENPFKIYHRSRNEAETDRWAAEQAQGRRDNPTDAEAAVASILDRLGITYVREKIWANGSKPIFSDFYLPDHKMTLEIDGERYHKSQAPYDIKRAMWLARTYGVGTMRYGNKQVLSGRAENDLIQRFHLKT